MSGGGLSLLADLAQGPIFRFWWNAGQQRSCSLPVGHRLTRDAAPLSG